MCAQQAAGLEGQLNLLMTVSATQSVSLQLASPSLCNPATSSAAAVCCASSGMTSWLWSHALMMLLPLSVTQRHFKNRSVPL